MILEPLPLGGGGGGGGGGGLCFKFKVVSDGLLRSNVLV